tara:strand:+ start:2419 stop:3069 length:651 start_codon:yes stop_codon:yes gene_type:complete
MDLKDQILVALGLDKKEEEVSLTFQAKLEDGTIVVSEADMLAEGVDVSVLAEDGSILPMPIGEYKTEDALAFIVEEEGIVASVSQGEVEVEDEPTEEAPEEEAELEVAEEEVLEDEVLEDEAPVVAEAPVDSPKSITTTTSTTEEVKFNKEDFLTEINDSIVALKSQIEDLQKANDDLTTKLSESAVEPLNLNKHSEYTTLKSANKFLTNFNNLNK